MPGNEGLTYNDTPHEMDAISRYTAFLSLQAKAHSMSDQEYIARLDAIMEAGGVPEGAGKYTENDLEIANGISQAVIDAILTDDGTKPAQKRVLQFEQYGGTFAHQMGEDDPADASGKAPGENGDPTLEIRFDENGEPVAANGDRSVTAGDGDPSDDKNKDGMRLADGIVTPADGDPTLEIKFDENGEPIVAAEDGPSLDSDDAEKKTGDDPEQGGVYKHVEVDPEESEPEKADGTPSGPAASHPDGQWPGTVGATTLDLDDEDEKQAVYGGGLYVTENFQINDWLDELGAGTGLLKGVQTAEYIPPAVQPANSLVKSPLMQKLDRKIEYTYGSNGPQKQPTLDGPNA